MQYMTLFLRTPDGLEHEVIDAADLATLLGEVVHGPGSRATTTIRRVAYAIGIAVITTARVIERTRP